VRRVAVEETVEDVEAVVAGVEARAEAEEGLSRTTTHAKALWPQGCENRPASLTLSSIDAGIRVQREA
jgi:hypothetical protein